MSTVASFLRRAVFVLAIGLTLATAASAQELPVEKITGEDLRRALIWTGHFSVMSRGDPLVLFHQALADWQKSKGYAPSETPSDDQAVELLAEGDKQRDAVGWAKLEDKSVGFSIGVPTGLVKFLSARPKNNAVSYDFEGGINYVVGTRYGDVTCANMNNQLRFLLKIGPTFYREQNDLWFAAASRRDGMETYARVLCDTTGIVFAGITFPESLSAKYERLFSAMAESMVIGRSFNPTAIPRPHLDTPPPTAGDMPIQTSTLTPSAIKVASEIESTGTTPAIKREPRDGADLSVEQLFERVSPAVYIVKADKSLGSAVAIGDDELLTNCHVVKDNAHVTLWRDHKKLSADVVSANAKADRCILKTAAKLETWVAVRPYDDIKVGERAITVGTPQGLELTVAEGIVSSKRLYDGRRLVQTTAAISQGSSGGGLFDAQGHLLGITTFYLKAGQNLNFAVAAEDFAK